jgi:putative FmdB family regulatory protein
MPVYEYVCTTCRSRFEKLRSMDTSQETTPCPGCGTPAPRALSVFAAFTSGANGEMEAMFGGGCACGAGGACGCAPGMQF